MLRLAISLALAQFGFHSFIASLPVALHAAGRPDPEIGLVMGTAALVPIGAALAAGGLIDRFRGRAVFLAGAVAFLLAALLFAAGLVTPSSPLPVLLVPRILQGLGIAFVLPAGLSLVPGLVPAERLGLALGVVGVGGNLSLAISPSISLAILDRASLQGVGLAAILAVVASLVFIWGMPRPAPLPRHALRTGWRTLWPRWRSAWAGPLAVTTLFLVHWGIITSYLPQRSVTAGADVGLFFTADAVGVLALRVPAGYLAGRLGTRWLIVSGVVITFLGLLVLFPRPTTELLILAGAATGAGAALLFPPITLELTTRSGDHDRGSALSLYNICFSGGIAAGSIGVAALIDTIAFEGALVLGLLGCGLAAALAAMDRGADAAGTGADGGLAPEPDTGTA
jgi:MFS family permease